ncbi:MAG TPA: iron-containing alcohol dehydrogenase [Marinobacterium sp.]|nr:iron-containing alcohol dehydrogenase [Marinobacterium sp.]
MHLINYLTRVQFGFGSIASLQSECDLLGIKRPLFVTDKGVRAAGVLDQVTQYSAGFSDDQVFDETPSNPNEAMVRKAAAQFRDGDFDGLVAVGGGSAIDLAKGVAVCATHPGSLSQYALIEGGLSRITSATAPVIAVPTTAGTGSEVGRGGVLILDDGRKVGVISPYVVPKVAICDPELTLGLPPSLTAATGMDAIAHCMETFMSSAFNPPADGIALDGLRRGWAHIERATLDGSDREARLNMMSASMQGAMAFQKGLGAVHSLSHSLGGVDPRLHHGTLNAIFLPLVVEFNASCESMQQEQKLLRMAQAMGLGTGETLIDALNSMNERLGMPNGLSAMGVTTDLFDRVVAGAMRDHCHNTNPRIATPDQYHEILQRAL